jgi:hypothetical protein
MASLSEASRRPPARMRGGRPSLTALISLALAMTAALIAIGLLR